MPSSTGDPAPSFSRSGSGRRHRCEPLQGVHGRGHHAWEPTTPRETSGPRRDGHTSRRPPRRSSCHQAGLILRPTGIFTIAREAAENSPRNRFSPNQRGGSCMPQAGSYFAASTKVVSAMPAETAYVDQPLTLSTLFTEASTWEGGALWRLPTPLVHG